MCRNAFSGVARREGTSAPSLALARIVVCLRNGYGGAESENNNRGKKRSYIAHLITQPKPGTHLLHVLCISRTKGDDLRACGVEVRLVAPLQHY